MKAVYLVSRKSSLVRLNLEIVCQGFRSEVNTDEQVLHIAMAYARSGDVIGMGQCATPPFADAWGAFGIDTVCRPVAYPESHRNLTSAVSAAC